MRTLINLFDQQKQGFGVVKDLMFTTHPSVDLLNIGRKEVHGGKELKELVSYGNVMKENAIQNSNMSKHCVLSKTMVDDGKENVPIGGEGDLGGVVVFSGSRKSEIVSTLVDDVKGDVPIGGRDDVDGVVGLLGSRKRDEVSTAARKLSMEVLSEPSSGCRGGNKENVKGLEAVLPQNIVDNGKENVPIREGDLDQFVGFSGSRLCDGLATVARKLPMEALSMPPSVSGGGNEENVKELGGVSGKQSGGGSRILAFVRLRPMWKKEKEAGARCCVRVENRRDVYLNEFANENDYLRLKRLRGRHFTFDAAFAESTSQLEVYSTTTAELVEAVLQGRNGSVFCYGATGAGKTHTMLGTVENPGVMVLAIKDLFNKIRERSFAGGHVVHLSYLEVYNETVRDLLSPGRPLVLREDKQGIVALGLTQYKAYSTDEVMSLLQQGNHNRTTEPTRANETSSRSHAILQVMIEYHMKNASNNVVKRIGKLSLIDLAGSERAHATDQRTLRSFEGANINRSLLALSSCINALVEGKKHIPYRNSKLTQLLKDSLSGACNTVMIANVSPSNLSFGETQNTLHWADRAKEIRTKICDKNEDMLQLPESETDQAKLLLELQKENHELRKRLNRQQQKLLAVQAKALAANSSSAPSKLSSQLSAAISAQANGKRRTRSFFLSRNCFTPESKRKGAEDTVRELSRTMKVLEAEMERMKMNHALNIKQKDDIIRKLSQQLEKPAGKGELTTRVITRTNLRSKEPISESSPRCPSHRFQSPAPPAKKRSFWGITTANSPFLAALNERKTRSHIATETKRAPSKLCQLAHTSFWFLFLFGPHFINYTIQPAYARLKS